MHDPQPKFRLATLYPHYADAIGVNHIALEVCGHLRGEGLEVRLLQPASDPPARKPFTRDAVPPFLKRIAYRFCTYPAVNRYSEKVFLRSLRPGEVAYLYPGVSLDTYRRIKERGHRLVVERINCHTGTAKPILDDAFTRLGLPIRHPATAEEIRREREELELADLVFAPSPLVRQSMLDNGVPAEKVLSTSYGWDPGRLRGTAPTLPPDDGLTVLFVGTVLVRKGAHLLLEAWASADLKGRLVYAGEPEPVFESCFGGLFSRPDVLRLGFVNPVEGVYRSADVFAFPSLEEGSPLVSYEALACGLPVLASPMAAGEVIRHGREGFVLDPYDRQAWIEALRRLAGDRELRKAMGESARARAAEYTWEKVGRRRRELLLAALAKGATGG
jgi:glycosyltransferase involved in cell wall biosynthesis